MTTFSRDRMRGHRDGLGLTLTDLGRRTGINPNTLRSYESGKAEPPARRLGVLAEALDVHIDDLYGQHGDPIRDYCAAVAAHGPPMSDQAITNAATVLRTIRRRMRAADDEPPDAA